MVTTIGWSLACSAPLNLVVAKAENFNSSRTINLVGERKKMTISWGVYVGTEETDSRCSGM